MKIAFVASLYEKEAHQFHYLAIINLLEGLGHSVFHRHITQANIDQLNQSENLNTTFHQKVFQTVKKADLVVVEISQQSLGVGYVIGEALKMEKPVIALTDSTIPPLTIYLEEHESLLVHQYNSIRELGTELPLLLSQIEPKKEKKFNFFLPSQLDKYLHSASQKNRQSKSAYLRQLLEKDRRRPPLAKAE